MAKSKSVKRVKGGVPVADAAPTPLEVAARADAPAPVAESVAVAAEPTPQPAVEVAAGPVTVQADCPVTATPQVVAAALAGKPVVVEGDPAARLDVLAAAVDCITEPDAVALVARAAAVDALWLQDGVDDAADALPDDVFRAEQAAYAADGTWSDALDALDDAVRADNAAQVAAKAAGAEVSVLDQTRTAAGLDMLSAATSDACLAAGQAALVAEFTRFEGEQRAAYPRLGRMIHNHRTEIARANGTGAIAAGMTKVMAAVEHATGTDYTAIAGRCLDVWGACRVFGEDMVTALPVTGQKGFATLVDRRDRTDGTAGEEFYCRPGIRDHAERLLAASLTPRMAHMVPPHIAAQMPRSGATSRGTRTVPGTTGGLMVTGLAISKLTALLLAYAKGLAKGNAGADPFTPPVVVPAAEVKPAVVQVAAAEGEEPAAEGEKPGVKVTREVTTEVTTETPAAAEGEEPAAAGTLAPSAAPELAPAEGEGKVNPVDPTPDDKATTRREEGMDIPVVRLDAMDVPTASKVMLNALLNAESAVKVLKAIGADEACLVTIAIAILDGAAHAGRVNFMSDVAVAMARLMPIAVLEGKKNHGA